MALIQCSECNGQVSDQAAVCPHCGAPVFIGTQAQDKQLPGTQSSSSDSRGSVRKGGGHVLAWIVGIIVAIPVIFVAGVYVHNKAIGPVGWAQDNTEKALKRMMKDPDSMVVRSSYVVQKTDDSGDQLIYVCGIVDGKNSFGGYAGGSRFASKSTYSKRFETFDTQSVHMEDAAQQRAAKQVGMLSGFDKVYWNDWCVDSEHPAVIPSKDD